MGKKSTEVAPESSVTWESLEAFARAGVQGLLQRVLEEEVAQLLGRHRYERREAVDAATSIARLKASWQAEYGAWRTRSLADLEVVYLWVDGVYVKAGLEKDEAAILVVIAGLRDGRKIVLAVESGYRESTESWTALLRDLQCRGLRVPRLIIGDGHLGIWLAAVFPTAREQRCWNHRILNVLDKLPKRMQAEARKLLTAIPYAETREAAERQKRTFQAWCTRKGQSAVGRLLDHDWDRLVTFYAFPKAHWKHLRTTNVVESPFAAVRLRTAAAKRFKKVENATAVICKTLLVAEQRFRWLDAPELLPEIAEGVVYVNGERVRTLTTRPTNAPPPDLVYTRLDKTSPPHGMKRKNQFDARPLRNSIRTSYPRYPQTSTRTGPSKKLLWRSGWPITPSTCTGVQSSVMFALKNVTLS
jgi:transposase-like protein